MALKVDNKKKILSFKKMIKSRRVKSTQITISKTNVNSSTSLNPDECIVHVVIMMRKVLRLSKKKFLLK